MNICQEVDANRESVKIKLKAKSASWFPSVEQTSKKCRLKKEFVKVANFVDIFTQKHAHLLSNLQISDHGAGS